MFLFQVGGEAQIPSKKDAQMQVNALTANMWKSVHGHYAVMDYVAHYAPESFSRQKREQLTTEMFKDWYQTQRAEAANADAKYGSTAMMNDFHERASLVYNALEAAKNAGDERSAEKYLALAHAAMASPTVDNQLKGAVVAVAAAAAYEKYPPKAAPGIFEDVGENIRTLASGGMGSKRFEDPAQRDRENTVRSTADALAKVQDESVIKQRLGLA